MLAIITTLGFVKSHSCPLNKPPCEGCRQQTPVTPHWELSLLAMGVSRPVLEWAKEPIRWGAIKHWWTGVPNPLGGTTPSICSVLSPEGALQGKAPVVHSGNVLNNTHIMGLFPFPRVPAGVSWDHLPNRYFLKFLISGSASEKTQSKTSAFTILLTNIEREETGMWR